MRTKQLLAPLVAALACTAALAQMAGETATIRVFRDVPAGPAIDPAQVAAQLRVPSGFAVNVYASGLGNPRMIEVGPDGAVYVTRRRPGDVLVLRDTNGDGAADDVRPYASGLPGVHGIALHGQTLYLASSTTIWSTPLAAATPEVLVSGLPDGGQHPNRMVRIGPDGMMYVSVATSCNDCAEENQLERATMMRYTLDGMSREIIANGLRATIGYDWHPATQALWGMDHGMDFHGDEESPEELNHIRPGLNYGWPICYGARVVDPLTNATPDRLALKPGQAEPSRTPMTREEYCAQTEPASISYAPHSAPIAMQFYRGTQFPLAYRGNAFVAMRGSWNRSHLRGYKVVRIRFDEAGQPRDVRDFVTGFMNAERTEHYGRPAGIATLPDGSLLVGDDTNGVIYRVRYTGQSAGPAARE